MDFHSFLFWVFAGLTSACAIATVVTHNIVRAATWLLFTLAGTSGLFFLAGADLVGAIQLLVYVGGTMVLVVFGVMLTAQGPFISMRTSSAEWAVSAATGIVLLALLVLSFTSKEGWKPDAKEPVVAYGGKAAASESAKVATSSSTMVIGQGFAGVGVGPAHRDPNRPSTSYDQKAAEKADRKLKQQVAEAKAAQSGQGDAKKVEELGELNKNLNNLPGKDQDEKKDEKREPKAEPAVKDSDIVRAHYLFPFEIVSVHLLVVLIGAAYLARAKRWEGKK